MTKKLPPITPGEILKEEFLIPLNMTMSKLAKEIHVPENRISQIIAKKRDITVDTAFRLGKFFKTGPEFWLNLQTTCNLRTQQEKWQKIEPTIPEHERLAA